MKTFTGSYQDVRLGFALENLPLESPAPTERYATKLAFLHIYLDGINGTEDVSSAYLLWVLSSLLYDLSSVLAGKTATTLWYSDPWQLELRGDPMHNRVFLTLHIPGSWRAMYKVSVPLEQLGRELIRVTQEWLQYLDKHYHDQVIDPHSGKDFRRTEEYLQQAQAAFRQYET